MDSFDKKISDLYNADQSSNDLPEGFGWEDMNEGIYEKMEEPKRKKKFFWMWFSFGGSLFLLATLLFFFNSETKNIDAVSSKIEKANTQKTPIHLDKNTIENNLETPKNIQQPLTDTKETNTNSRLSSIEKTSKKTENKTNLTENLTISNQVVNRESIPHFIPNTKTINEKETRPKNSISFSETPSNTPPKVNATSTNVTTISKEPKVITNKLDFISIKKFLIPTKQWSAPAIVETPSEVNSSKGENQNKKDSNSKNKKNFIGISAVKLYGGTLLSSGKYSQNSLRNKHSNWLPGYYTGLEFTVLKYKNWNLNLGYEHKFAVQLFDFQNITDIVDYTAEDVVTGISTNSLNGSTNEHRETISTQAIRTRNYLNYNTFRAHAFRMTLERRFNFSKNLSFNAGFGGTYNFLNRAEGRTVDGEENTLNYDPSNSIYRKNNFGLDGGFSLSYQIGKFSLDGNVWLEKSLNFSVEAGENIRPVFYKIGLGVSRRF